ncbi:MAG: class IV adenylate cyclase [Phycisphaeraceae bacterium]
MSVEIEAKMRLTDRAATLERLHELKAERHAEILETNTYFDTEKNRLKSADEGLRIRVEQHADGSQRATITHKGPRAHGRVKSRSEHEVSVDDPRAAGDLLSSLGYVPVLSFEKRRMRYLLDGCCVELDSLPYIGEYIEIEGPTEDQVLAMRERLGLDKAPLVRASYIAMLDDYIREHRLQTSMIRLDPARRGGGGEAGGNGGNGGSGGGNGTAAATSA